MSTYYKFINKTCIIVIGITFIICHKNIFAQSNNGFVALQKNMSAARYEINTKRLGIDYNSKEASTAGKEFERIDPTYYVGYMLQGTQMFYQSADLKGYSICIPLLKNSLQLLEKDFKKELKLRTTNVGEFMSVMQLHKDYDYISYCLNTAYANINEPDSAWLVTRNAQKLDLQDEMYMDTYNSLAWLVHRNRFYTNKKYSFLKNSISENENYANALLDSAILKINRDGIVNKDFYSGFVENKMSGVYHYKAMVFAYALDIDNAQKYFNAMQQGYGGFSHNNYANFCGIQAKFAEAEKNYKMAEQLEPQDKRLREFIYYGGIIDVYKAKSKESALQIHSYIKSYGSASGVGWYNIALARSLLYDGQFFNATTFIAKADSFKELHIGTTLGASHYTLSSGVLKLIAKDQELQSVRFRNSGWWYSIKSIFNRLGLLVDKYMMQYFLVNEIAANPERENVMYKLFSTESTISFDEIWYLVQDYSTNFFIKKMEAQLLVEKRPAVVKYFKLILAKLYVKENNYTMAKELCNEIIENETIDPEYEKLFSARLLETQAIIANNTKQTEQANSYIKSMFEIYPQLIPYSGLRVKMQLQVQNNNTAETKKIISGLQKANINFTNIADANTLIAQISFEPNANIMHCQVVNNTGKILVPQTNITYQTTTNAINILPFCLFNIGLFNAN